MIGWLTSEMNLVSKVSRARPFLSQSSYSKLLHLLWRPITCAWDAKVCASSSLSLPAAAVCQCFSTIDIGQ